MASFDRRKPIGYHDHDCLEVHPEPTCPNRPRDSAGASRSWKRSPVTAVIGVGVVAMLQLWRPARWSIGYSNEQTTAVNLANNIHEIALGLPVRRPGHPSKATPAWTPGDCNTAFDDVLDSGRQDVQPAARRAAEPIANYANWTQQVSVRTVRRRTDLGPA